MKSDKPFGWEQFVEEKNPILSRLGQYAGEMHFGIRARANYIAVEVQAFSPVRLERILDAGCGKGQTAFWLSRRFPKARIDGIDINPDLVRHCGMIAEKIHVKNISFQTQDVCLLEAKEKYDIIVCCDVLEHIEDWKKGVRNLTRALRPGGILLIHVPHAGRFQESSFGLRAWIESPSPDAAQKPSNGTGHVREGLTQEDFSFLREEGNDVNVSYTFGIWTMCAHTLFEAYRSRPRYWHLILTPLLGVVPRLEKKGLRDGGGMLVRLTKTCGS